MVASVGIIASLSQGAGYFEKDGYYARDDTAHTNTSVWAGRGTDTWAHRLGRYFGASGRCELVTTDARFANTLATNRHGGTVVTLTDHARTRN